MNVDTAISRMPKTELHLHLEGAVDAGTFADLASRHGIDLPAHDQPRVCSLGRWTGRHFEGEMDSRSEVAVGS